MNSGAAEGPVNECDNYHQQNKLMASPAVTARRLRTNNRSPRQLHHQTLKPEISALPPSPTLSRIKIRNRCDADVGVSGERRQFWIFDICGRTGCATVPPDNASPELSRADDCFRSPTRTPCRGGTAVAHLRHPDDYRGGESAMPDRGHVPPGNINPWLFMAARLAAACLGCGGRLEPQRVRSGVLDARPGTGTDGSVPMIFPLPSRLRWRTSSRRLGVRRPPGRRERRLPEPRHAHRLPLIRGTLRL